jgi:hypothetical protein
MTIKGDVRFGSKADMRPLNYIVRFVPKADQVHRSNFRYSITASARTNSACGIARLKILASNFTNPFYGAPFIRVKQERQGVGTAAG